jgi:hypothetical protein
MPVPTLPYNEPCRWMALSFGWARSVFTGGLVGSLAVDHWRSGRGEAAKDQNRAHGLESMARSRLADKMVDVVVLAILAMAAIYVCERLVMWWRGPRL